MIPQKPHPLLSSRAPAPLSSRVYFLLSSNSELHFSPRVSEGATFQDDFTLRRSTPFHVWGLFSPRLCPLDLRVSSSPPFPLPDASDPRPRPGRLAPAPTSASPAAEVSLLPPRSAWGPRRPFPGVAGGEGSVLSGPARPLPGRGVEGLNAWAAPAAGAGTHLL